MLAGLGIAVYYMLSHVPVLRSGAGWLLADGLWFGIQPISAGVFGVPVGLIVAIAVSRITRPAPALPLVRSEM
jgi:cation/acetate symporter